MGENAAAVAFRPHQYSEPLVEINISFDRPSEDADSLLTLFPLSNYDGVNSNTYSKLKVRTEIHLHPALQSELVDGQS